MRPICTCKTATFAGWYFNAPLSLYCIVYTIGWDLVLFRVKEDEEQINVAVYANPRKRAELICCCTYKFKMILYRKQFCKIICFRKDIRQERVQYPCSPMLTPSKLLYFWKKLMIKITKQHHTVHCTVWCCLKIAFPRSR